MTTAYPTRQAQVAILIFIVAITQSSRLPILAEPIKFIDVTTTVGFKSHTPAVGLVAGAAAADYDADGFIDIFVPQGSGVPDRLYRNQGDGTFADVAVDAGVASMISGRSALWLDYDGDQKLDLLVGHDESDAVSSFTLFRQTQEGVFEDVTVASGLFIPPSSSRTGRQRGGPSQIGGMCSGDINNDGHLDLFIGWWSNVGDQLFLNTGQGAFIDISEASGVADPGPRSWQPLMVDFDGDGWLDIYVARDFSPNRMWRNQGNQTFADVAPAAGLDNSWNEMGMALGDYDNDGDFDIYVTNIYHFIGDEHNILLRNDSVAETLVFTEVSEFFAVDNGDWGWGTTFLDVDNDGFLDLAATNGYHSGVWNNTPSRFFLNVDGGTSPFLDVTSAVGFDNLDWGAALLAFDYDRDGDLDLLQVTNGGPLRLLQNQPLGSAANNHSLVVKPRMTGSNRYAIGAVVRIDVAGTSMMRLITAGTSLLGQEPAEAFFGLGSALTVDTLEIDWPDGVTSTLHDVAADQILVVVAPADCNGNGVDDSIDIAGGSSPDCNGNDIPDECEFLDGGDCDENGVLDACEPGGNDPTDSDGDGVSDFCDPCPNDNPDDTDGDGVCDSSDVCPGSNDAADNDGDGVPDGCDVCPEGDDNFDADADTVPDDCDRCPGSDDTIDTDGDGVPDGCDVCDNRFPDACTFVSPILAPPPHNILKNRYLSIDPRGEDAVNVGVGFDIQIRLVATIVNGVTAVGSHWWADTPDAECISVVGRSQPASPPNWDPCPTLHLTGCSMIPTSTYDISVVVGGLVSDPPLSAATQAKPGVKWHGDCVGFFTGTEWTGPNANTNIDDAVAAVKTFQNPSATPGCPAPPCNATHVSVTDMVPNLNGMQINKIVNINDVFSIILGFQGQEYPGPQIELCLDP